jgi:hypothetical protein
MLTEKVTAFEAEQENEPQFKRKPRVMRDDQAQATE